MFGLGEYIFWKRNYFQVFDFFLENTSEMFGCVIKNAMENIFSTIYLSPKQIYNKKGRF